MKKPVWLVSAALTGALCAPFALADTVKLLPSELEMPDRIGPLIYTGPPGSWPDPRLGKAYAYHTPGMQLDIYVYDAGLAGIPEGAVARPICEQFEQAKSDVMRGGYTNVTVKSEQLARMGLTQDPPLAREAVFEAVMKDVPSVSYLWITGVDGNFIKLRFSVNAQLSYELDNARRAVLNAVGDAIRPHLASPASPRVEKQQKQTFVFNPESYADAEFGAMYLTALAVQAAKQPDVVPPCGGPLRPGYRAELAAYQFVLRLNSGEAGSSKFAAHVARADKAGFLEEFVWTYSHQDFWGDTVPEGLDLAAFRKWSGKNLKRLKVPRFGYVEFNEGRGLPIEPM